MDASEIAKGLTEVTLQRVKLSGILGRSVRIGEAEKIGNKIGELYKGIFDEVTLAIESSKAKNTERPSSTIPTP